MPLSFSEREETKKHWDGIFKLLKNTVRDMDSRNTIKNKTPAYILPSGDHIKSDDELSVDGQSHIYISEEFEEDSVVETTALRHISEESKSSPNNASETDNYLTVSGTIKRGKKKGQSIEVILNISREELEIMEANMINKRGCFCNTKKGIGLCVLLWTILCFPFSVIVSGVYSFCMGTITWYNVFKYFSEYKTVGYRVLLPPLLVIFYPFIIIIISIGLGLYAGVKQLSCCWDSWQKEFTDYEKGFFGWLCNLLDIPECCPYEVVILSAIQKP